MKTLRVAIIDDSKENIETLEYLLEHSGHRVEVVSTGMTLAEASRILQDPQIEVAFLDIQLKKGNIFEVLQKIFEQGPVHFESVFVTAHGSFEFALKAIRYACLDFITKPIDQAELDRVLTKAINKKSSEDQQVPKQLDFVFQFLKSQNSTPSSMGIILPKGVIEFVDLSRLIYMKAEGSTCKVFLSDRKVMNSTRHLGYYIDLLQEDPRFLQISKNHLINHQHLRQYNHKARLLTMADGSELNASVRFSKGLKQRLLEGQKKSLLGGLRNWFE